MPHVERVVERSERDRFTGEELLNPVDPGTFMWVARALGDLTRVCVAHHEDKAIESFRARRQ